MGGGSQEAPTSSTGGGSGRRYNTDSLDLSKWAKKKKKLEAKIEVLQEKIQEKRDFQTSFISIPRFDQLNLQIRDLQAKLLVLLAELDELRKVQEEDEEMSEVMAMYLAYRRLH